MDSLTKKYRIHTEIGKDKMLNINLNSDIGLFQILSMELKQQDAYVIKSSNYGVIVGRILANKAFGVENVRVSVFIPIDGNDSFLSNIRDIYPYKNTSTKNDNTDVRYNLMEQVSDDDCHANVGTFPDKRYVLDNESYIEVFDKYYKYTTRTNKAGDYMLYGIPVGNQSVHVDCDLSDIGMLSQRPRDFYYKGYNENLFKNSNQFKESTNIDSLVQIISQNQSVYVYPFWGDTNSDDIAITRNDVDLNYEFEPTCVFIGSVITDTTNHAIGDRCVASANAGKNGNLVTGNGTIEMIRKTTDGYVEEFSVKGGRVIDGDGVWCYQIPMNLDYIKTDEEGNISPSDNPNEGIATRCRVRFRISMDNLSDDGSSRFRAKYLIPNNPELNSGSTVALKNTSLDTDDSFYTFGSNTDDSNFRDICWNKVYSIKSFIPRIDASTYSSSRSFIGLKTANTAGANNSLPYNVVSIRLNFSYRVLCILLMIVIDIITAINEFWSNLMELFVIRIPHIWTWSPFGKNGIIALKCIAFVSSFSINEDDTEVKAYFPGCDGATMWETTKAKNKDKICTRNTKTLSDDIQDALATEYDAVNMDFSNDWLNGTLYFPVWHWMKKKKRKWLWGLFSKKAINRYCGCDFHFKNSLVYLWDYVFKGKKQTGDVGTKSTSFVNGVIKDFKNKDNLDIYYYACGMINESKKYYRLFSTDLILLGSLSSNDSDGIGQLFKYLPPTTSNMPPITSSIEHNGGNKNEQDTLSGVTYPNDTVLVTGMDDRRDKKGLFYSIGCTSYSIIKQGTLNAQRICELGTELDMSKYEFSNNGSFVLNKADGYITKTEIYNNDIRSQFASMNYNPLNATLFDIITGQKKYVYAYKYPSNFNGALGVNGLGIKSESESESYSKFRFGGDTAKFYLSNNAAPLYNNSFYFYFGLKEGKTAIEQFRDKYYSDCIPDQKYGASILVSTEIYDCDTAKNEITVTLTNINTPYSFYIVDENGNTVMQYKNCEKTAFSMTGTFVTSNGIKLYGGGNIGYHAYKLVVEDKYGSKTAANIDMTLATNSASLTAYDFKVKSSSLINGNSDIINGGYISISSFSINGLTYNINSINENKGKYINLTVSLSSDPKVLKYVKLVCDSSIASVSMQNNNLLVYFNEAGNKIFQMYSYCNPNFETAINEETGTISAYINEFEYFKLTVNEFSIPYVINTGNTNLTIADKIQRLGDVSVYQDIKPANRSEFITGYDYTKDTNNLIYCAYKLSYITEMRKVFQITDSNNKTAMIGYDCNTLDAAYSSISYYSFAPFFSNDVNESDAIASYGMGTDKYMNIYGSYPDVVNGYSYMKSVTTEHPITIYSSMTYSDSDQVYTNELSPVAEKLEYIKNPFYNGYGTNGYYMGVVASGDGVTTLKSPEYMKIPTSNQIEKTYTAIDRNLIVDWFSALTIDKRLSYEMFCIPKIDENTSAEASVPFVLNIYNGNYMGYDIDDSSNTKNVISSSYTEYCEYYISSSTLTNPSKKKGYLYDMEINNSAITKESVISNNEYDSKPLFTQIVKTLNSKQALTLRTGNMEIKITDCSNELNPIVTQNSIVANAQAGNTELITVPVTLNNDDVIDYSRVVTYSDYNIPEYDIKTIGNNIDVYNYKYNFNDSTNIIGIGFPFVNDISNSYIIPFVTISSSITSLYESADTFTTELSGVISNEIAANVDKMADKGTMKMYSIYKNNIFSSFTLSYTGNSLSVVNDFISMSSFSNDINSYMSVNNLITKYSYNDIKKVRVMLIRRYFNGNSQSDHLRKDLYMIHFVPLSYFLTDREYVPSDLLSTSQSSDGKTKYINITGSSENYYYYKSDGTKVYFSIQDKVATAVISAVGSFAYYYYGSASTNNIITKYVVEF
jgi:hypothetical protein